MFKNFEKPIFIGKNLIYLPACQSTNDLALQMLKEDDIKDGTLIITSDQKGGRGQRGNKWFSEPGKNLTFSILTNISALPFSDMFNLSMAVSTGITEILSKSSEKLSSDFLKIKWPNDIYYIHFKLGGILIETGIHKFERWAVIGIGININQENFNYLNASSLKLITGLEISLPEVCENICIAIEKKISLMIHEPGKLREIYYKQLLGYKEIRRYKAGEELLDGIITGVTKDGRLMLEVKGTTRLYDKKEITFLMN